MEIVNKDLFNENVGGDAACNIVCAGACLVVEIAALGGWASKAI